MSALVIEDVKDAGEEICVRARTRDEAVPCPGCGEEGLTVKLATRFEPPPLEIWTDRRPIAEPQEEFVAVTSFVPGVVQATWIELPFVPPVVYIRVTMASAGRAAFGSVAKSMALPLVWRRDPDR